MTVPTDTATPNDGVSPSDDLAAPDAVEAIDEIEGIDDIEVIEVVDAPAPNAPDRADAPVSEITERFLKVVLAHVPLDRIEELHLFSPLRQGGVETGIAVIAARVPVVVVEEPAAPEFPFEDVAPVDVVLEEVALEGVAIEDVALEDVVLEDVVLEDVVLEDVVLEDVALEDAPLEDITLENESVVELLEDPDDEAVIETTPVPRIRHTVYTARYRLVQKGPERGKWEADVVAEAEAPLITVDLVVRGVQRRAGEESEIVRYSAPQLARALRVPYPAV